MDVRCRLKIEIITCTSISSSFMSQLPRSQLPRPVFGSGLTLQEQRNLSVQSQKQCQYAQAVHDFSSRQWEEYYQQQRELVEKQLAAFSPAQRKFFSQHPGVADSVRKVAAAASIEPTLAYMQREFPSAMAFVQERDAADAHRQNLSTLAMLQR